MPQALKICSWHIQGIHSRELGHKLDDTEVKNILTKYDIICLVETHCSVETSIELKGYTSITVCRPLYRMAKKSSGGIAVLFRNELVKGVSVIKSKSLPFDMVWLKLCHRFFNRHKDVYIGITYMSPENSSYVTRQDVDLYNMVENEVVKYASKGDIMLLGDLNARTANENDFILNDQDNTHIPIPDDYTPDTPMLPRQSYDKCLNISNTDLKVCMKIDMDVFNK